jgi:hypothetical protein
LPCAGRPTALRDRAQPLYFEELIDVGTKQVALEKRKAEEWLAKTTRAFPKVHSELVTIEGPVAPRVATRAKVADISVLPRIEAKEEPFWASARDAALFHSGRPVLVVPEAWNDPIGETVVIAWKDTVEAVRAVVAAQPFLIGIKHVKLVSVMEHSKDETGAAGMADYLSKADLRVERVDLAADGDAALRCWRRRPEGAFFLSWARMAIGAGASGSLVE